MNGAFSRRNKRYFVRHNHDPNEGVLLQSKNFARVMTFGLLASEGQVMLPIFVAVNFRINSLVYQEVILSKVTDWLQATYSKCWRSRVVLQQDGVSPHTSNSTQTFLEDKLGKDTFWDKSVWPPSSLDLNMLDFWVWAVLEVNMGNRKRSKTLDWLQNHISVA